jgi:hypothetical protein
MGYTCSYKIYEKKSLIKDETNKVCFGSLLTYYRNNCDFKNTNIQIVIEKHKQLLKDEIINWYLESLVQLGFGIKEYYKDDNDNIIIVLKLDNITQLKATLAAIRYLWEGVKKDKSYEEWEKFYLIVIKFYELHKENPDAKLIDLFVICENHLTDVSYLFRNHTIFNGFVCNITDDTFEKYLLSGKDDGQTCFYSKILDKEKSLRYKRSFNYSEFDKYVNQNKEKYFK